MGLAVWIYVFIIYQIFSTKGVLACIKRNDDMHKDDIGVVTTVVLIQENLVKNKRI